MLSACTVSQLSKDELIKLEPSAVVTGGEQLTVKMNCSEKVYSLMPFVLIPAPPIIPLFFLGNENSSLLHVHTSDILIPSIELRNSDGDSVEFIAPIKYKSARIRKSQDNYYYFDLNKNCSALDKHVITVTVGDSKKTFYIRYTEDGVKFEWSYVRA